MYSIVPPLASSKKIARNIKNHSILCHIQKVLKICEYKSVENKNKQVKNQNVSRTTYKPCCSNKKK